MNARRKLIPVLLVIAVMLFGIIRFWAVPARQAKREEYARNQTDALTHDIASIAAFKSAYLGDAGNTGNLFYSLPLCDIGMKFEIDAEACALTVDYLDTVWSIGEEKVRRDLVYNSIAAMAAIDNLQEITYNFSGDCYAFTRQQIEGFFDGPLSELLENQRWSSEVQSRLESTDFVAQFF